MSQLWTRSTPVLIDGDWSVIESEPWFSGSGTLNAPYIITNLTIDLNFAETYKGQPCLRIKNSDKYFIITQSKFLSAGYFFVDHYGDEGIYTSNGIYLDNVENGAIMFNEFSEQPYGNGVTMRYVSNIQVKNNTFTNCVEGLRLEYSDHLNITGNVFTDNFKCIFEVDNTEVIFDNNTCIGEENPKGITIPGYEPFLVVGVLLGISMIPLNKKLKRLNY